MTRLPAAAIAISCLLSSGCAVPEAESQFFGKVEPPEGQVLRYISGSEPESMDPQVATGQPEARILMAIHDGLVEYDPKTNAPIPAIAERWDVNVDASEFVFHLRANAKWSNGQPITAHDFVYSLRRGRDPAFAARNAYVAYYVRHAQGYNEGGVFVRDPRTGAFVLEPGADAAVERRLILPADAAARQQRIDGEPALKAAVAGKEFVAIRAEDIGIEALDDRTLRI